MKDKSFHFKEDTVTKKTLFKTFKIKIRKTNTHAKKSLNCIYLTSTTDNLLIKKEY